MSELGPELLLLLEKARADHEPSLADEERVRVAVFAAVGIPLVSLAGSAQLGAGAVVQAAQSSAPATGTAGAGALSGGAWVTAAKVVIGLAVSGLGLWTGLPAREANSTSAVQTARQVPHARPAEALPVFEPPASSSALADQDTRLDTGENVRGTPALLNPAVRHRPDKTTRAAGRRAQATVATDVDTEAATRAPSAEAFDDPSAAVNAAHGVAAAPSPAKSESAHPEIVLIRAALTALNRRDPDQALSLLQQHRSTYPQGIMDEERDGLRIIALCERGRLEEGRHEGQSFLNKSPHSPLSERIKSTCWEQSK